MSKKKSEITIRSSAAEYLTFIAASGDVGQSIEIRYENENIWLTQKMMAELYDVTVAAINQHLKKIFADNELAKNAVIKKYLITAADGKCYNANHYNLQVIIADVSIAENYFNEKEMNYLERIVSLYLDYAELQAERKTPMSMEDWAKRLDGFLEFNGNEILTDAGKISGEQAKLHAETEFETYRIVQDKLFQSDFDRFLDNFAKGGVVDG